MTVGSRGMFVGDLAMFMSRGRVLLRVVVLAEFVMMGRLMVVMSGSVVVSGRLMVMLTRRMLRCLCHLWYSFLRVNKPQAIGGCANRCGLRALLMEGSRVSGLAGPHCSLMSPTLIGIPLVMSGLRRRKIM